MVTQVIIGNDLNYYRHLHWTLSVLRFRTTLLGGVLTSFTFRMMLSFDHVSFMGLHAKYVHSFPETPIPSLYICMHTSEVDDVCISVGVSLIQ